jgi:nicotinamidase-related amidase
VIHVVVGFRPGMPEVSTKNQAFSNVKQQHAAMLSDPRPAIAPEGGEVVVTKRRVSAFTGSDLEVVLRAGEIDHLVLCGIATSGVVLSTLREAADKDFRLTVLADLCADTDAEVHAVLTGKVFPRQARVMSSAEWLASVAR